MKRQISLDTETTGLSTQAGHRIIEIGCVELVNRRLTGKHFHVYLQPEREIDEGAIKVHGITNHFLADKPLFGEVVHEFLAYIEGAELIIHNAAFDVGFLNHEMRLYDPSLPAIDDTNSIIDTLAMARKLHPGQRNNLDALCKRYSVSNAHRQLHGGLLDAEILAELYIAMTAGQTKLRFTGQEVEEDEGQMVVQQNYTQVTRSDKPLTVIYASEEEQQADSQFFA